jgi:hypothetical protein
MLVEGSTATSYEPYYEPVTHNIYLDEPLRKVGNYADYIDFSSKKVVRYINRVKATSAFSWNYIDTKPAFYANKNNTPNSFEGNKMSTHFELKAMWALTSATDDTTIGLFSNTAELWIRYPKYKTTTEFEAWLDSQDTAGTPVYVDYAMKTPIETPVDLPELSTLSGTTYVSAGGANIELKVASK